jgi:hypothetical protein
MDIIVTALCNSTYRCLELDGITTFYTVSKLEL